MSEITVPTQAKPVVDSMTVILNGVVILVGILSMPQVTELIPAEYLPIVLMIVGGGNALIRVFKTVGPLAFIKSGTTTTVEVGQKF